MACELIHDSVPKTSTLLEISAFAKKKVVCKAINYVKPVFSNVVDVVKNTVNVLKNSTSEHDIVNIPERINRLTNSYKDYNQSVDCSQPSFIERLELPTIVNEPQNLRKNSPSEDNHHITANQGNVTGKSIDHETEPGRRKRVEGNNYDSAISSGVQCHQPNVPSLVATRHMSNDNLPTTGQLRSSHVQASYGNIKHPEVDPNDHYYDAGCWKNLGLCACFFGPCEDRNHTARNTPQHDERSISINLDPFLEVVHHKGDEKITKLNKRRRDDGEFHMVNLFLIREKKEEELVNGILLRNSSALLPHPHLCGEKIHHSDNSTKLASINNHDKNGCIGLKKKLKKIVSNKFAKHDFCNNLPFFRCLLLFCAVEFDEPTNEPKDFEYIFGIINSSKPLKKTKKIVIKFSLHHSTLYTTNEKKSSLKRYLWIQETYTGRSKTVILVFKFPPTDKLHSELKDNFHQIIQKHVISSSCKEELSVVVTLANNTKTLEINFGQDFHANGDQHCVKFFKTHHNSGIICFEKTNTNYPCLLGNKEAGFKHQIEENNVQSFSKMVNRLVTAKFSQFARRNAHGTDKVSTLDRQDCISHRMEQTRNTAVNILSQDQISSIQRGSERLLGKVAKSTLEDEYQTIGLFQCLILLVRDNCADAKCDIVPSTHSTNQKESYHSLEENTLQHDQTVKQSEEIVNHEVVGDHPVLATSIVERNKYQPYSFEGMMGCLEKNRKGPKIYEAVTRGEEKEIRKQHCKDNHDEAQEEHQYTNSNEVHETRSPEIEEKEDQQEKSYESDSSFSSEKIIQQKKFDQKLRIKKIFAALPNYEQHYIRNIDAFNDQDDLFTKEKLKGSGEAEETLTEIIEFQPEILNNQPPEKNNFRNFDSRKRSFISHGRFNMNAEDLARAGFCMILNNSIQCFSCFATVHLSEELVRNVFDRRWHRVDCQHIRNIGQPAQPSQRKRQLDDVETDGSVSDDIRDPPGQQSIYVPPGDNRSETYRLSTYEHFPVACPISKKSLASAGFYFTGFFDRVKCFACGRTVERWDETDNPTDLRFHKQNCPFPRGGDCGNIPVRSLFNRSSQASASRQREEILQQTDPNTGGILRTVRYPADLPERIRQSGGIFEIGPDNSVRIQAGPGHPTNPSHVGSASARAQPPRRWRMANVISSDHRRFLTNLHLNRELDRVASFARWPVGRPNVSPAALARSGFFYLGDMDRTQCFSCGGVLRNWTLDDDAQAEHRSHFPQCQMVLGTEERNFPVQEYPDSPSERVRDYPCRFPSNPHMRNAAAREDTFDRRWPAGKTASTPQEISQAGFFFLGERDRVKCWYCNGGLQNWEYDDMPWIEHAKWFPTCQFLLQVKGQHFVYRHLSMNPHLARPIIAKQDGASVDPTNQAGNSGESSNNRNGDVPPSGPRNPPLEPTPEIIDPQAEMRKRKEKVKHIMQNSDLVKSILMMGFDGKIVEALLEDKIESGNVANPDDIYDSMSALLDDVMKKEEEIKKDELEERMRQMQAMTNGSGAAAMSFPSYNSIYSSMSTPMSSLGPAPGSGKYQVSYIDENDEAMDEDMYGAAEAGPSFTEVTPAKQLLSAEGNSKSLQEQLNQIEEERLCKICFSNPADMVFIPCSHMICCMECTQAIRQCPVCRKKIEKAMKTYVK